MRIIDAHNHPDWHGHDFAKFIENMDRYGIEKTWLLSWECPKDEYDPVYNPALPNTMIGSGSPIPFSRCIRYQELDPERFILGYAPDPRRPDAIDSLHAAIEIYNVKVCGEVKLRMMYDNRDAIRMWKFCGEKKLPVVVHIDYEFDRASAYPRPNYWYGGGFSAFERAVKECGDTIFLGHSPGFWAHISGDYDPNVGPQYPKGAVAPGGDVIRLMRECPNLYGDLSAGSGLTAVSRDPEFGRDFLLEFQDRLLFARDDFNNNLQEFLLSLQLPETILAKIFHQNAEALIARQDAETDL